MERNRLIDALVMGVCAAAAFGLGAADSHFDLPPVHQLLLVKRAIFPQPAPSLAALRGHRGDYYPVMTAYFAKMPGPADVVMLGDSITEWSDWRELLPNTNVINRGIRGDTSDGVLERLPEVVRRNPKIVVLMIGVNDLYIGLPPSIPGQNIISIARELRAHGTRPLIVSTLYTRDRQINLGVAQINQTVSAWAKRERIPYLDLNEVVAPQHVLLDHFTWDGIHLNVEGYLAWRDRLEPNLVSMTSNDP